MENVVKLGYLECYVRGVATSASSTFQWQKRFYVLYGATANSKGRLDYYDDEESYRIEPKVRKTIYLEEMREFMPEENEEKLFTFQLIMCRNEKRIYHFAAATEQAMHDWLKAIELAQIQDTNLHAGPLEDPSRILVDKNAIYESAEDFQQYTVEVQATEAAKRCHLKISTPYELFVLSEYLCLAERNKRILSWSYKHIRRYGCGENNFTFEAGRKSLSGEGLFSFLVKQGEQLFRNVQERMKHMQKKQNPEKDDFNKLLRSGGEPPSLPTRNYAGGPAADEEQTHQPLPYPRRTSAGSEAVSTSSKPKVPPKLPALTKVKSLEKKTDGVGDKPIGKLDTGFQSELNNALAKKPPMLKPRTQNTTPPVAERHASLGSGQRPPHPLGKKCRISTGENYELAKSNLPGAITSKPMGEYAETTEERVLDPNYSENKKDAEFEPTKFHEYAEYDIARSSRFQSSTSSTQPETEQYCVASLPKMGDAWKKKAINDNTNGAAQAAPPGPIYDTPAEADVESPKMSTILAKLNKLKTPPTDAEYDRLGQHQTEVRPPTQGFYDQVVTRP